MKKRFAPFFVLPFFVVSVAELCAETIAVNRVSFTQDAATQMVTVHYALANNGEPAYVRLDVFTNGVSIGAENIHSLQGDVSQNTETWVADGENKTIVWNARKDWPGQLGSNATVSVTAWYTNRLDETIPGIYMVVDLSGGTNASSFPVRFTLTPPDPLADVSCASNHLWLKRIEAGSFFMGRQEAEDAFAGSSSASDERRHKVTLTMPFFAGVFPVTCAQYQLVTGVDPSMASRTNEGKMLCPAGGVSYLMVRGNMGELDWPVSSQVTPDSFVGRFRAKVDASGLFDLPTDARAEYVYRAGATTAWNNGTTITNSSVDAELDKLGWYNKNSENKLHPVGLKQPNAWGIYDTHGGVFECCLDRGAQTPSAEVVDPVGPMTGENHVQRGGSYTADPWRCRNAYRRYNHELNKKYGDFGFRLFYTLP